MGSSCVGHKHDLVRQTSMGWSRAALSVWFAVCGVTCGPHDELRPCIQSDIPSDCLTVARPPERPESCLWVHDGTNSGYRCVVSCSGGTPCPGELACTMNGASSCMTCQDVIDVCE